MNNRTSLSIAATLLIASAVSAATPGKPYDAAIVIEPTSKRVLFADNAETPLPVASMTKMMTLLITMENVSDATVTLETPVDVSARASKMGGSQTYLKEGERFSVRDLVAATMVHSANDAAMALAERIAGTPEAFVKLMNRKAAQLGMKSSTFYSPHGLPGEGVPDDVMSARDAATLGIEIMKIPLLRELAAVQTMPFRGNAFTLTNPNHLLRFYSGANGIKTGYHGKAGFCVTGSARRNGMELVSVVMGSQQKKDNFSSAAELLTDAFNSYRMAEPVRMGMRQTQPAIVKHGEITAVPVYAGSAARVLVATGEQKGLETAVMSNGSVAPIRKGQQVGFIVVTKGGKAIAKVPALAAVNVELLPWWKRAVRNAWPF